MSYNPATQSRQTLRASTTAITTSYDSSPAELRVNNQNQLILYCDLALNTATSVEIQVDFATPAEGTNVSGRDASPASSDWFTRTYLDAAAATASSGTMTVPTRKMTFQLVETGRYEIPIPMMGKWVRVRAKTTLGPGTTTLSIVGAEGLA